MKEVVLKIEGMHCNGCSTRLERVNKAKVELEKAEATIEFDETKISIEKIKEAIEDAGFKGE